MDLVDFHVWRTLTAAISLSGPPLWGWGGDSPATSRGVGDIGDEVLPSRLFPWPPPSFPWRPPSSFGILPGEASPPTGASLSEVAHAKTEFERGFATLWHQLRLATTIYGRAVAAQRDLARDLEKGKWFAAWFAEDINWFGAQIWSARRSCGGGAWERWVAVARSVADPAMKRGAPQCAFEPVSPD